MHTARWFSAIAMHFQHMESQVETLVPPVRKLMEYLPSVHRAEPGAAIGQGCGALASPGPAAGPSTWLLPLHCSLPWQASKPLQHANPEACLASSRVICPGLQGASGHGRCRRLGQFRVKATLCCIPRAVLTSCNLLTVKYGKIQQDCSQAGPNSVLEPHTSWAAGERDSTCHGRNQGDGRDASCRKQSVHVRAQLEV